MARQSFSSFELDVSYLVVSLGCATALVIIGVMCIEQEFVAKRLSNGASKWITPYFVATMSGILLTIISNLFDCYDILSRFAGLSNPSLIYILNALAYCITVATAAIYAFLISMRARPLFKVHWSGKYFEIALIMLYLMTPISISVEMVGVLSYNLELRFWAEGVFPGLILLLLSVIEIGAI